MSEISIKTKTNKQKTQRLQQTLGVWDYLNQECSSRYHEVDCMGVDPSKMIYYTLF